MTETTIRFAGSRDLSEVLAMIQALAEHHGDTAATTLADLERDTLQSPPWVTLIVAEKASGLLGYAALCPLAQLQFGVRGMDMHHLFVMPEVRGQGIAHDLIKASIEYSKGQGCRYVMVGTHPNNKAAQQVYLAAGFSKTPEAGPRFRIRFDAD